MKTLIVIGGPTASGKTSLAIDLAQDFNTEILSADSRQVYREMNIGTAKPTDEQLNLIPHHFINSHSIHKPISAGDYEREALAKLDQLFTKYEVLVAAGGSGLYIKALTEGLDEMPEIDERVRHQLNESLESHGIGVLLNELQREDPVYFDEVDQNNPRRVIRALEIIRTSGIPYSTWRSQISKSPARTFKTLRIGIAPERELLYHQIEQRIDEMIAAGLIDEAKELLPFRHYSSLQTVGYTEVFDYLENDYDMAECIRLLKRNTRRYAKRQITWFKNQEDMEWFSSHDPKPVLGYLERLTGH